MPKYLVKVFNKAGYEDGIWANNKNDALLRLSRKFKSKGTVIGIATEVFELPDKGDDW